MKTTLIILVTFVFQLPLCAQFNRLPVSLNAEINIPKSISNKAFVTAFTGNLDWNANLSYHYKNKLEFSAMYRRANFKAGYNNKKLISNLDTKFVCNNYGIRTSYSFFDNAYFYAQAGLAFYYCNAFYNNVTYLGLPIKNPQISFILVEPMTCINYKASEYVDVGFQLSGSISNYVFNPKTAHLDEANKFGEFPKELLTNGKTAFISFGFTLKWYLQFEKNE